MTVTALVEAYHESSERPRSARLRSSLVLRSLGARQKEMRPPTMPVPSEEGTLLRQICEEAAIRRWAESCVCEHLKCQVTRADVFLRLRKSTDTD